MGDGGGPTAELDSTFRTSTLSTIKPPALTPLGYALLGLLHKQPASGYDLRTTFTRTPIGRFSDSPGAIYPALRRLEQRKLVRGVLEAGAGMRRRRLLHITPAGRAALEAWLTKPVGRADVVTGLEALMLRFALIGDVVGKAATLRLLGSMEAELKAYIPSLKGFLKANSATMTLTGRLALENGILGYDAQLRWVARAIAAYTKGNSG